MPKLPQWGAWGSIPPSLTPTPDRVPNRGVSPGGAVAAPLESMFAETLIRGEGKRPPWTLYRKGLLEGLAVRDDGTLDLTDPSAVSDEEVRKAYDDLNRRPRKRYGWRCPLGGMPRRGVALALTIWGGKMSGYRRSMETACNEDGISYQRQRR